MTKKLSRRAALAGLVFAPAVAAAPAVDASTAAEDPFLAAFARYQKIEDAWTAMSETDYDEDDFNDFGDNVLNALIDALKTTPTTDAGLAVLHDLLASDPHGDLPVCAMDWGREGHCVTDAVCAALKAAAEMLRRRDSCGVEPPDDRWR